MSTLSEYIGGVDGVFLGPRVFQCFRRIRGWSYIASYRGSGFFLNVPLNVPPPLFGKAKFHGG